LHSIALRHAAEPRGVTGEDARTPGGPVTDRLAEREVAAASTRDRVVALFSQSAKLVHRTAYRITGRAEDAEDVLQAVFLALLEVGPSSWPDEPTAYVRRAAANAALDVLRRRKRWSLVAAGDDNIPPSADHEGIVLGGVEGERLAERLRLALPRLSPLEAEVFALHSIEEMSNVDIARLLGKTANHVGVTLHAARRKLQDALAPDRGARSPSVHETSESPNDGADVHEGDDK
jgi:RNA polymerase sigma-70 factor (ECF subfamily)